MTKKQAFALAFTGFLGFAVACSQQGEGERCNSDDDCATGLSCVARTTLIDQARACCPTGDTTSSSELCRSTSASINDDASGIETPDTGAEPDTGQDADAGDDASETPDTGSEPDTGSPPADGGDAGADAGQDADAG